jgi:tRNA A-37 threonylcarbamoyl transferase component Bud32
LANPERIGRYVIERLLGQGAMGQVYLGRDPSLDRKVAIKTVKDLDLEPEKKQRFLDRFKNEARAAARLSHASIVQVYDVGEDEGLGPFLVLEYIRGSSLKQILREAGPLLPARLCEVARDLGAGIDVAHAAGIIHRDIKPDNVLTGEDGRAKLADFGVARVPDAALTKEGQFLGTPCYAAPETLSAGRYSPQSDLFSFAVVLYELASGERAFPGDDAIAVAHQVIHDEPPPASEVATGPRIPAAVDALLIEALAKDPDKRPRSATEIADRLLAAYVEAGMVDATTQTIRASGSAAVPSGGGSGSGPLGAVLGLLLLAAVGVAIVLGVTGQGEGLELDAAVTDAGVVLDAGARARPSELPDSPASDSGVDAPDGGEDAPDAPLDVPTELSRTEREDMAKDELDRAREAIATGDARGARQHLERARELDPESSDLEEIQALLDAMP